MPWVRLDFEMVPCWNAPLRLQPIEEEAASAGIGADEDCNGLTSRSHGLRLSQDVADKYPGSLPLSPDSFVDAFEGLDYDWSAESFSNDWSGLHLIGVDAAGVENSGVEDATKTVCESAESEGVDVLPKSTLQRTKQPLASVTDNQAAAMAARKRRGSKKKTPVLSAAARAAAAEAKAKGNTSSGKKKGQHQGQPKSKTRMGRSQNDKCLP